MIFALTARSVFFRTLERAAYEQQLHGLREEYDQVRIATTRPVGSPRFTLTIGLTIGSLLASNCSVGSHYCLLTNDWQLQSKMVSEVEGLRVQQRQIETQVLHSTLNSSPTCTVALAI